MTEVDFVNAVTAAVRRSLLPPTEWRQVLSDLNAELGVKRASDVGPDRFEEYLGKLSVRLLTVLAEKTQNPDKKREVDSALKTVFSIHHLNLAYWMGRSLGDGSRTLESWQAAVYVACGAHTALGDMNPEQCRATMIASGLFTPSNLPVSTEHIAQRMN